MNRTFLKLGAVIGALSVALGAFGAHALKQHLVTDELAIFETAVRYQFYHVFALLSAGILFKEYPNKWINYSGRLFTAGIILFSGSLYLLTFLKASAINNFNWVGAITPLGGLAFICGWLSLFAGIFKK
ncbi:MAG: DUF423 domain-containing protein [Sphingobacteriales bacterium]